MLQVARLAPKLLGDSADLVRAFLLSRQNTDGGFQDRTGDSDLYYTVFGLDGLLALQVPGFTQERPDANREWDDVFSGAARYASMFEDGAGLDFVHLCCLARVWATLSGQCGRTGPPSAVRLGILGRLEGFRSRDGGYYPKPRADSGSVYGCFLGLGAHQDLNAELSDRGGLIRCLKEMESADGAWFNERVPSPTLSPGATRAVPGIGSTNAAAAAVSLLRSLSAPIQAAAGDWLIARCHSSGGFLASPGAPIPDLLSTATALHALAGLEVPLEPLRERCLDFVDSLWTNSGGFHGNWADDALDCEYTYYGLLALGHLS